MTKIFLNFFIIILDKIIKICYTIFKLRNSTASIFKIADEGDIPKLRFYVN